jgi:hypothetical protein
MPVIMRALKVCSGASTKKFSRRVSFLRYATVNIMRSPVFDVNVKKPPRNARALEHREESPEDYRLILVPYDQR